MPTAEGLGKRWALVGSKGMLASTVQRLASPELELFGYDLPDFDLTDREGVLRTLGALRPDVILNCAAYTDVDGCETREKIAFAVNGEGPGHLAEAAAEIGALLFHISTDYVFDGEQETPYREDDPPNPRSVYGRSKLKGEEAILGMGLERFFIVRTAWLYGPNGKNFVDTITRLAREREELRVVADQVGSPTRTDDLAEALFRLAGLGASARSAPYGIYHFSDQGSCSWYGFAEEIVAQLRLRGASLRAGRVVPIATDEYPQLAPRPRFSLLSKEKYRRATGAQVPEWRASLARYFDESDL